MNFSLFVAILCVIPFARSQFYTCQSNSQCRELSLPSCGQVLPGWCDFPRSDEDCSYRTGGVHVEFGPLPGIDFCSQKCNSDSDCGMQLTAKFCTTQGYCGECRENSDCNLLGFQNHICPSGYCQYAGTPGLGQCFPKSPFCVGVHCYDDTVRCWTECQTTNDCLSNFTCLPGVIIDAPWKGICIKTRSDANRVKVL